MPGTSVPWNLCLELASSWAVCFWGSGVALDAKMVTSLLGIGSLGVGILMTGLAPPSMFWLALLGYGIGGLLYR